MGSLGVYYVSESSLSDWKVVCVCDVGNLRASKRMLRICAYAVFDVLVACAGTQGANCS